LERHPVIDLPEKRRGEATRDVVVEWALGANGVIDTALVYQAARDRKRMARVQDNKANAKRKMLEKYRSVVRRHQGGESHVVEQVQPSVFAVAGEMHDSEAFSDEQFREFLSPGRENRLGQRY
jgi:hypothetical protein